PGLLTLTGFVLALAGIWFISSMQNADVRPEGIRLALVGGFGFGLFFICMGQFQDGLVLLPLVVVRVVSVVLVGLNLAATRQFQMPPRTILPVILFAGLVDALGNIFFVMAKQTGRLDITSVLSSLYPVATVVLALILLRERMNRPQTVGIVLVLLAIPMIAAG
ncbi:MAG TPA: EamA family transporter, partial [Phototrophicaceae bacterium]|nr:EamA family transporter [Phototrophicaceae bacterium]